METLNTIGSNKTRFLYGYQNTKTKTHKEDLAITPYIFLVHVNGDVIKVFGLGICWIHSAFYIGIGFNFPKGFKI